MVFTYTIVHLLKNKKIAYCIQSTKGSREVAKIKRGQNRNSAPFKIQYPMKNRGKNKGSYSVKQQQKYLIFKMFSTKENFHHPSKNKCVCKIIDISTYMFHIFKKRPMRKIIIVLSFHIHHSNFRLVSNYLDATTQWGLIKKPELVKGWV